MSDHQRQIIFRKRSKSQPSTCRRNDSHPSIFHHWEVNAVGNSVETVVPLENKRKEWNTTNLKLAPAIEVNNKGYKKCGMVRSSSSNSVSSTRTVQAFTAASRMKNVSIAGPPKLGIFKPRPSPPTTFRMMYERGDIPVTLHHDHRGHSLRWKVDLDKIDYHHYLPLFFDGLRETTHPYDYFSRAGVTDLLARGGDRILPVIPQLILPLKSALNTRDTRVVVTVLHVIQELVMSSPHIGEALVPYYRQLLPTLNLFKNKNANIGDEIDYSQRRQENLGDLVQDTLEMLERRGGRDAYINIKYMVPTYQSCILT